MVGFLQLAHRAIDEGDSVAMAELTKLKQHWEEKFGPLPMVHSHKVTPTGDDNHARGGRWSSFDE
ncbi:UNVERIFIED_CONTAM: hypothetical protein Sradi_3214600 [Sesamum radiatum]|uniref:Uncharacterized protein n=1 Tax=Sesamum radiatum TaxID=300843 RepID=A0AAW2RI14_SESRA